MTTKDPERDVSEASHALVEQHDQCRRSGHGARHAIVGHYGLCDAGLGRFACKCPAPLSFPCPWGRAA
jgi:hypothetical protein